MTNSFLLKYNRPGPRYTSYPPATFFHSGYGTEQYKRSLVQSNSEEPRAISLYVHIPFCPKLCHFCGCNTGISKAKDHIERYVDALITEIRNVAPLLDLSRPVTQIHWGGGTPNSIPMEFIQRIMDTIHELFLLDPKAEVAIECSPAYLTKAHVNALASFGFNRISLGIQDFQEDVLEVINRLPSRMPIEDLVAHIRQAGFQSINMDLIYGLPKQTTESFTATIQKAIDLQPDRLVTFSYAHVPWMNPNMRILEDAGLPSTEKKFSFFDLGYSMLSQAGYVPIGLDHYAKPEDSLAQAMSEKKLHRNFQGYCTRETTGQVYAFGASGISQLWSAYSQNIKSYEKYIEAIEQTGFAVDRGYEIKQEEIICRETINSIMCNGYLDMKALASRFSLTVEQLKELLKFTPDLLNEFIEDKLVEFSDDFLTVSKEGMLVVRNIAMAFDPQLESKQGMYSKTI